MRAEKALSPTQYTVWLWTQKDSVHKRTIYSRVPEGSPDGVILGGIMVSSQQSCLPPSYTGLTQPSPSQAGRQDESLCVSHHRDKAMGAQLDTDQH